MQRIECFGRRNLVAWLVVGIAAGGLSACGGGGDDAGSGSTACSGGQNVYTNFNYSNLALTAPTNKAMTPQAPVTPGIPAACAGQANYSVASGQLPPGVSLNPKSGVISGAPVQPGVYIYQIQLTLQGFKGSVSSGVMVDVYDPARFSVSDWVAVNTNVPMLSDFRLDGQGANLVATTAGFYTRTMDTFVSSDGGQTWNLMGIAGPGIYTKNFATTSDGASIYYSSGVAGIVMPGQIWKFNGVGWSQRMGMAFTARQRHALAKFNGSLYAIGGITADGLYQGDVWRSTDDGANWIKVATPFYGRADVCAVAFQGKLVAIAGSAPGKNVSEVWSSPDGVRAVQALPDASPRHGRAGRQAVLC